MKTGVADRNHLALARGPRGSERSMLLTNIAWKSYEKLLEAFGERRNPRLIYDRGDLEIMPPISNEHEFDAEFLSQSIAVLADEMDLDLCPGGSFTMKRKDLDRGL